MVALLLARKDVNPNSRDKHGWTPLRHAAHGYHREVIVILLEHEDVDVNLADNSGKTPLSEAVARGHQSIAVLLIQRGASVHAGDDA